jgi:hypothetical protein
MAAENTTTTTDATDHSASTESIPIGNLIAEERTLAFCGLDETTNASYPDEIAADSDRRSDNPWSFTEVIDHLPTASSGQLYANNPFVDEHQSIDTAAVRAIDGLDSAAIEAATGHSIEDLATMASMKSLIAVEDHQDIVDKRRLALHTLGAPVKFRWQIASTGYCIVLPMEAYLPAISALRRRDEHNAFGWAHYRDWGGELKLSCIFPSLKRTLVPSDDTNTTTTHHVDALTGAEPDDDGGVTVFGGFQTGYDFRGTQTVWATPLLYLPASDVIIYGIGQRYSRRHVGNATNASHERANNRVPINEWWDNIYGEISAQTTTVDRAILRSRAVAIDFDDVPYSIAEFYTYLGIPAMYADEAAERAHSFASPSSQPTLWNLQLSLLVAIDTLFEGSPASDTYLDHNEVAQQLLRQPARSIQLAATEHDLQADSPAEHQLPPEQQTLSDAIEDLVAIPGVSADTEADLDAVDAQHIQDGLTDIVQQRLDHLVS